MTSQIQYAVGQRWLSNSEVDLGLGVIMAVELRSVTVLFPAVNEERSYSKTENALARLALSAGEQATHVDGFSIIVDSVDEQDGLLSYTGIREDNGEIATIVEVALDHNVKVHQPEKRLFLGQLDDPRWFDSRLACWDKQYELASSDVVGLMGARVELIPHQIHIAHEVGKRYAPRVLLADEVGLGKTIEAALIIHQQLLSGRASRVLICVPESLTHQWLVEMLRRVNLRFSIFDEERMEAVAESGENPFAQEQLVLCSQAFIQNEEVIVKALDVDWDILVVDEAHHLKWSAEAPSAAYQAIEKLSHIAKGVLLLTATPDQLGHESHFARLRLLDPARFHSYDAFIEEEAKYSSLASAVTPLIENNELTEDNLKQIANLGVDIGDADVESADGRKKLMRDLIDQHGTGRLLFRNRRAAIEGFPERLLHAHPLKASQEFDLALMGEQQIDLCLHPERSVMLDEQWPSVDPRVNWLIDFLTENKQHKVLVICAYASTALQIAEYMRTTTGIRHSVFHEGMSIVERDKAAHFFASNEQGAQVLLCSEIGSEGRNFQFCHQLVLFDLPINPDLLEQRIGRLDRIGQTRDVNIHVPYFTEQAQEVLFNWYDKGLNAFEKTCPVGSQVFKSLSEQLTAALESPLDRENWEDLCQQASSLTDTLRGEIENGRDRLLELNSSGGDDVDDVIDRIIGAENPINMMKFMTRLLDSLGVIQEEKDDSVFVLRQGESMMFPVPGLSEEGTEVTYKRSVATQLEHVHYLSGDSEIVNHCIDSVLTDVVGKSSICFVNQDDVPVGAFWVELVTVLAPTAESKWQVYRYLPTTPQRVLIDAKLNVDVRYFEAVFRVKPKMAKQLITALTPQIKACIEKGLETSNKLLEDVKRDALSSMNETIESEHVRLTRLQQVNPSIRDEELEFLKEQQQALNAAIQNAAPYLDSIRIVVNNPK